MAHALYGQQTEISRENHVRAPRANLAEGRRSVNGGEEVRSSKPRGRPHRQTTLAHTQGHHTRSQHGAIH